MFDYQESPTQIIYVEEEKSPIERMNETIEDVNEILDSTREVLEIIKDKNAKKRKNRTNSPSSKHFLKIVKRTKHPNHHPRKISGKQHLTEKPIE